MTFKLSWQWWNGEDGKPVFGELSFVSCSESDPYRFLTARDLDARKVGPSLRKGNENLK